MLLKQVSQTGFGWLIVQNYISVENSVNIQWTFETQRD